MFIRVILVLLVLVSYDGSSMAGSKILGVFLLIIISMLSFLIVTFLYNQIMFSAILPQFVAEFLAGLLGIILGFTINRIYETGQKEQRARFILQSLRDELELNLGEVKNLKENIYVSKECFIQLKTSTWDMFGNQLESLKDVRFALSLSILYWEFSHLNEMMKKAADIEELVDFYTNYPPYPKIEGFIANLEEGIISCLEKIDELLMR